MELQFDTVVDDGRVDECEEVEPRLGADRSFETVRTGGPSFHLMPDGTLTLESESGNVAVPEFGTNVTVLD
ncbi:hypothetical protein HUG10_21220 (plasmid) [Halorarum halophilum]|uniref:Uncharacterized protein n=1 Tax=Halorarum halophilum TaxID=2743090 RepID=A0A7D5GIR3_9EURY|nr:hypothetical protein [Halobaculum halophilum]QLG30110.1 hypothetical protein HUG10_21220 [Halobaculum halophilum]